MWRESGRKTIEFIGCVDIATACDLPAIDACDIVSYLVLQTTFLSLHQFKVHKSLEAYNQFINGWVKDIHAWSCDGKVVITENVSCCNYEVCVFKHQLLDLVFQMRLVT